MNMHFGIENCVVEFNKKKNTVILYYSELICDDVYETKTKTLTKTESLDILRNNSVWISASNKLKFKNKEFIPHLKELQHKHVQHILYLLGV